MIHTTHETVGVDFNCPIVQQSVHVKREYANRVSQAGKRFGKALTRIECSHGASCPALAGGGADVAADWDRCAFLHPVTP